MAEDLVLLEEIDTYALSHLCLTMKPQCQEHILRGCFVDKKMPIEQDLSIIIRRDSSN